jgi:hypothetical protein
MTTDKEYQKTLELAIDASERGMEKATNPFLVETFCAQVAWMGKDCPVYPPTAGEPREVCKFLISEDHQDYRCPVLQSPLEIYQPIFEKGTKEQRESLELLADMTVRYTQNPIGDKETIWLKTTNYQTLDEAIWIYKELGLKEKVEKAEEIKKEIWEKRFENIKPISEKEKRKQRKRQRRLDRKSRKRFKKVFEEIRELAP